MKRRVVVILATESRPTGRGRAKERTSDARSVGGAASEGSHCSRGNDASPLTRCRDIARPS